MAKDAQAAAIANKHGIPYDLAYQITGKLRNAAMKLIFKDVSEVEWRVLSTEQKSMVCTKVIQKLMTQKGIQELLNKG